MNNLRFDISLGNRMNTSAIKDLRYKSYFKILSKLHKPSGECKKACAI